MIHSRSAVVIIAVVGLMYANPSVARSSTAGISGRVNSVKLAEGLYEALITRDRSAALAMLQELAAELGDLSEESAPLVLARHVHDLILNALRSIKGDERLPAQLEVANRLVGLLAEIDTEGTVDELDAVDPPGRLLLSLHSPKTDRLGTGQQQRPSLSLRQSDLLVNGPRDLRLGSEIRKELASADRLDLLIAFLKWSGLRVVRRELDAFCRRRPGSLRVLTTTYMGATDIEAIEALHAMGADIRVSYDTRRTRLHAKAWLFHRNSGFSTALVGSSNLSKAALLDGCEWNVRLSAVDNGPILAKFQTTFDQYWNEGEFDTYDRARFEAETERRSPQLDALARATELRAHPHQQRVLDALAHERSRGHNRNLVVAATGTGKTVVAALDYARLRDKWGEATLLFVAHRKEILLQSQATFRVATRDGHFGELLVDKYKPTSGTHVFAAIQALHGERLATLAPDAYDIVIVDEFHHAAAPTYEALLDKLRPKVLLGLTATPERADGRSILGWFDDRIADELRLWDALDLQLLSPFQYFGVHDGTDLSLIDWRAGRYDASSLEQVYTADEVRARAVLRAIRDKIRDPRSMRALGFCVSVKHAEFMAAYCCREGLPALAISGGTPGHRRDAALQQLRAGEINIIFSVDLFNEGVDVPAVDTVLFLRPTESATVFLQQLGRGLRIADDKDCLTVLDFIGTQHRRFRFDRRFRALLRTGRAGARRAVEEGFPHLPAGCEIQLDPESQAAVLDNLRNALPLTPRGLAKELAAAGDVSLRKFLNYADVELEEVYRGNRCFLELKHRAGLRSGSAPKNYLTRSLNRMLHIDDSCRLDTWRGWLRADAPPVADSTNRLQLMLFASLGCATRPVSEIGEAFSELWSMPELRGELLELLDELDDRRRLPTWPLDNLPFEVHATYSRDEISAGLLETRKGKLLRTQGGVYRQEATKTEIVYVTVDKDEKIFTPTTLYHDYPISPRHFHWETQGNVREESETGLRYRHHVERGWQILLFVRESTHDERNITRPLLCLGPVRYVSHRGEKPMQITWELERPMPHEFFQRVKVAAA